MFDENTPYEHMREVLQGWIKLPDPQWLQLQSLFQLKTIRKNEHIIYPGTKNYPILFVYRGLLRTYYLSEDGSEKNKSFAVENTIGGPISAFVLELPVVYGVQALEPSTLLLAQYSDFAALFNQHPVFDRLGRKLSEQTMIRKELRERSFLLNDAKERYCDFIKHNPDLVQRLAQYHIASYLGISEVSLSRLKRTLTQKIS